MTLSQLNKLFHIVGTVSNSGGFVLWLETEVAKYIRAVKI